MGPVDGDLIGGAMMTEPRPPWGVRLFREVALEALRGRREALIRRGHIHRCDL
jgi:hypothetical protein